MRTRQGTTRQTELEQWIRRASKQLRAVFLLIDIRHDPSENDRLMYDWILHQGYEPIIICTKLDKIKRAQKEKHVKAVRAGLGIRGDAKIFHLSCSERKCGGTLWVFFANGEETI